MNEPLHPEVAILNAALDLPASRRAAYLQEACAGNDALRGQVETLLQALDHASNFLEEPASMHGRPRFPRTGDLLTERPGDPIGPYTLIEPIGEGGCGMVWRAGQEKPVKRQVALKVIKLGMDTRQVIARFDAERQALAMMDHPNIAKVLDAGTTETGRPYFVMELVRGTRITDFCNTHQVSTAERLRLFIQVCQAIQHAHQKGVIHRDLKPSNILVTVNDGPAAAGCPKVIDFGIAKATQGRLTDQTLFTAFHQFIGTPAYMSPEQAQMTSLDIDTRSDIYSLGVLLYELLTGRTPFDPEDLLAAGLDGMRHIIGQVEPVLPSTRLTRELGRATGPPARLPENARNLVPLLRGDLDWIVMKCLEKDRARRYETANGLARDLQRHLNNEPVTARSPTPFYRFQKLVRRHRFAVAGVGVLALALTAVAVASSIAAWRVAGARRAEQIHRLMAETASRNLRQSVDLLELDRAEDFFRTHDTAMGAAQLATMLRRDPSNAIAATRLISALTHKNWAVPRASPLVHPERVFMATFSPDGRHVLTASRDKAAWMWDAATSHPIATFQHGDPITTAQYSPDGRFIVTASLGGSAQVWNGATGQPHNPPLLHKDKVYWAEFSADGRWVLTASADKTARIWDANSSGLHRELRGHGSHVIRARFSPDGRWVATGGSHGSVRMWSADSGEMRFQVEDRNKPLTALAFSPDGRALVSACEDGLVHLWDATNGKPLSKPLVHQLAVWHAAFSPDSQWLLTTSEDGTARVWDLQSTRPAGEPLRHHSGVLYGQFSADSRKVVTTSSDNTARVWDARTGLPLSQPLRSTQRVLHAAFNPEGNRVVTASNDGISQVWELHGPLDPGTVIPNDVNVTPLAFIPGGAAILMSGADNSVRMWDTRTGRLLGDPLQHGASVVCGDAASDKRRVALGLADGTAYVWDCGDILAAPSANISPRQVTGPLRHRDRVLSICFSHDGTQIVTASADATARVWDAATGRPVATPLAHGDKVVTAQFSRDGQHVLTASDDRTARVWDTLSGRPVTGPLQHFDHVKSAEFSPDGQLVVTASTDNTACVWNARNGQRITPPLQHARIVEQAIFSPDGRRVATGSFDRSARIWDAATGQALTPPLKHGGPVHQLFFTPDGRCLVTASSGYLPQAWDADTGRPLTESILGGFNWGACFDPDSLCIAVGSVDGSDRLWTLPQAPIPVPEWFATFAEAMAGIRLGTSGSAEFVGGAELDGIAHQLKSLDPNEFYAIKARWFLLDPPASP